MTVKIRNRMTGLAAVLFLAGASMAVGATAASAATGSYHPIVNRAYNQCIDVNFGSLDPSVQLQITGCNNTGAQNWAPVRLSSGGNVYYFVNQNSGDCIDVRGGASNPTAPVQQFPCNGTAAQQWIRTPMLVNGEVWETFINEHSGLCLDTVSGPGSKLMQFTCQPGNDAQLWQLR